MRPGICWPLSAWPHDAALSTAYAADPTLPGRMGIQPSPLAPAAFLIDVNEWLTEYQVSLG
ncbi:MAG: hypothetical protein ABJB47_08120 [Actinomycetota bacterium]